MKTYLRLLLILAVAIGMLTACGRGRGEPDEQQPTPTPAPTPAPDPERHEALTIRWGHNFGRPGALTLPMSLEELQQIDIVWIISSRQEVSIEPVLIQDGYDIDNPPDIFMTRDPHLLRASGVIREIPLDFVSSFAPQYYGLRRIAPFGFDIGRGEAPDSVIGLHIYIGGYLNNLMSYSVYRLDWLEEHGLFPAGEVVHIYDNRIYFTDTPFTHNELLDIMRAFSSADNANGLAVIEDVERLHTISQLMGMWGLTQSIVNDNGQPNYYFASPRYKAFLQFMAMMYAEGLISLIDGNVPYMTALQRQMGSAPGNPGIGWFQAHNDSLKRNQPAYVNIIDGSRWTHSAREPFHPAKQVFDRYPEARLLIAPPEIGPNSASGVGVSTALPYNPDYMWVIGAHVSDEKLAAILRIFDYVSFDTEAYVLTAFGRYPAHYRWVGEPYNSRIDNFRRSSGFIHGTYVLFTLFHFAETNVFYFGDNALTRHSSGPLGRDAIIRPYRQDIFGDFTAQYAALTARYGRNLLWIRQNFFSAAIGGEIDIGLMWDWYIDELNDNGLQQFLELVAQFPVVGP